MPRASKRVNCPECGKKMLFLKALKRYLCLARCNPRPMTYVEVIDAQREKK